jgi:uncharacterized membrane protein YkgB
VGRVESLAQQAAETTLNKYVLTELGRIAFGFEPSKAGRLTYGTVLLTYDFVDDPNEGLRLFVPRKARYSHAPPTIICEPVANYRKYGPTQRYCIGCIDQDRETFVSGRRSGLGLPEPAEVSVRFIQLKIKKEEMASTSDSRGNPVTPSDDERVGYFSKGSMNNTDQAVATGLKIENIGHIVIRYGVVIAVGWIGALKYTDYEDKGIEGLLVNSPLIAWAYHLMGLKTLCAVIGTSELIIAALLAVRYFAPKASVLGGIGAIGMFLTTLSFLFTTPGALMPQGFPFLSGDVGEFLIKDITLLGAAIWMTGDSLRAAFSKSEN